MTQEPTWRVVGGGNRLAGPFTVQQLRQMLHDGRLREGDCVIDGDDKPWAVSAAIRNSSPTLQPAVTIAAHLDGVTCLAYTPDGTRLATGSFDRCVRLWDVQTGHMLANLHPGFDDEAGPIGHGGTVSQVAFSADGRELASSSWDGRVCVWDMATKKQRHLLEGHEGAVNCVAYLSDKGNWTSVLKDMWDSFLLTAGVDGTLRIWNTATGVGVRVASGYGAISHFCLDPDGQHVWLAVTPRQNPPHYFLLADLHKAEDSAKLIRQVGGIRHVAASVDEHYAAVSSADGRLRVWGIEKRLHHDPHHVWQAQQGELLGVAFSPDAKLLASAGADGTVKVWNPANEDLLGVCRGHEGAVFDVVFSPDGHRLASCGKDGTVRIWDVTPLIGGDESEPPTTTTENSP